MGYPTTKYLFFFNTSLDFVNKYGFASQEFISLGALGDREKGFFSEYIVYEFLWVVPT